MASTGVIYLPIALGIAVALMGRSHPIGVFFAALLFGFLYQGGAELSLWTSIPRELIVVIQALVILFTGALDNMVRMPLERLFLMFRRTPDTTAKPAPKPDARSAQEGAAGPVGKEPARRLKSPYEVCDITNRQSNPES